MSSTLEYKYEDVYCFEGWFLYRKTVSIKCTQCCTSYFYAEVRDGQCRKCDVSKEAKELVQKSKELYEKKKSEGYTKDQAFKDFMTIRYSR